MNDIQNIYKKLLLLYGPQGWWPVTKGKQPSPTYHPGDYDYPKTEKQQFEIIIGSILTQNTAWTNVEKAIENLNSFDLIDTRKLSLMRHDTLANLIRSSGYYNQKAKKIRETAKYLHKRKIKNIFDQNIPELRKELLSLHGIGPETADSIILYAAKKPIFVIDAYTKRIFSTLGFCKENATYEDLQNLFMSNLEQDHKLFNEYHALLVEHAKRYYSRKETFKGCPLYRQYKK